MATRSDVRKAINLIHSEAEWQFFFEKISSPDWLEPLYEEGVFTKPENVIKESGIVRIPAWPPGKYLTKVAPLKGEKVVEIIKNIPETENPNILEACLDAVIAMPPDISVGLIKQILKWIDKEYQYNLPQKIGGLVVKYFENNKDAEALQLSNRLLYISPNNYEELRKSFYAKNTWEYNEIIKLIVSSIVMAESKKIFHSLLCDQLENIVAPEIKEYNGEYIDNSSIWRRKIQESNMGIDDDPKDILINWIYYLSNEISKSDSKSLKELYLFLCKRKSPIFTRIALSLLIKNNNANDLIVSTLLNKNILLSDDIWHEYALLLKKAFPLLDTDSQDSIINFISTFKFKAGEENTEFNEYRRYKLLTLINDNLSSDWKDKFNELNKKYNEIERPEYLYYFTGVNKITPISPVDYNEFQTKGLREIKQYLIDWVQPIEERYGESTAGLSGLLQKITTSRFDEFTENLELFKLGNVQFVGALIQGITAAVDEDKNINWAPVLEYCSWVVRQNDILSDQTNNDIGIYTGWNSVKQAVYRLIEKGFTSKRMFSNSLRKSVWSIIEFGISDHGQEMDDKDEDKDYYLVAINRARGVAFESAIRYGLWLMKILGIDRVHANRNYYPELFALLDLHLDVQIEKSKYIWAVYGRWFPWLFLLDNAWAKNKSIKLFSLAQPNKSYKLAAWDSYLMYSQPYDNVFDIIQSQYLDALNQLNESYDQTNDKPLSRLIDHIVIFVLRGKIESNSPIIDLLYKKANLKVRLHIISLMGRLLNKDVFEVAMSFWDFRINKCNEAKNWDELAEFGWWVKSDYLPDDWIFQQAIFVLEKVHTILPSHMVVDALVGLCPDYPKETFNVFKLIVDNKISEHGFFIWRSAAESLIPKLMDSPCHEGTVTLIHKLGSYGLVEFGRFLNE